MPAVVEITRTDYDSEDLRLLAAASRDGNQSRRLLALALVLEEWSRGDAARACGMDRQTLRDWVHRFNAEGPEGLVNRTTPGPACRLTADQLERLSEWIEAGPDPSVDGVVRWRCADLVAKIAAAFGVTYTERGIAVLLKRLGFRHVSARPRAPQADAAAQAAFKKTSPIWSRRRSRGAPRASPSRSGSRTRPA